MEELCCGRIVHGRIVRGRIVALPFLVPLPWPDYIEEDMDDGEPDIPLILGADDATYEGTATFGQMAHHYGIGPMEWFHSEEARLCIFRC